MKVMIIFGTRPEAIKLAPVVRAFRADGERFRSWVCVTAQHREMLDQVLGLFDIRPDFDLNVMRPRQDLYGVTSEILLKLKDLFEEVKPDVILVQGDTTTTFAASLAAFYQKIKIGHVEAGLRTFDKHRPFPEEMNRHLTSALADYHFAPTRKAEAHLRNEGIPGKDTYVVGNTVIDALLWISARLSDPGHRKRVEEGLSKTGRFSRTGRRLILVTAHRRESFGRGFEEICRALREIALRNPEVEIVYPVHLNPNVREPVYRIIGKMDRIHLIEPLEYEPFVYLMKQCEFILTDSGGIQEEAPSLGKPVLVMREVTERPEAVEAGTSRVVGVEADRIVGETQQLLDDPEAYAKMAGVRNPYGDGKSSQRILQILSGQKDWERLA